MHILITGAAGMIGRKLTERLIMDRAIGGQPIEKLTLIDVVAPTRPAGFSDHVKARAADLADPGVAEKAVSERPDLIFHLAGVVSGEAEIDFEKGYRVNLDGMRALLEACRKLPAPPKFVFASSVAAFGGELPDVLDDSTTPASGSRMMPLANDDAARFGLPGRTTMVGSRIERPSTMPLRVKSATRYSPITFCVP